MKLFYATVIAAVVLLSSQALAQWTFTNTGQPQTSSEWTMYRDTVAPKTGATTSDNPMITPQGNRVDDRSVHRMQQPTIEQFSPQTYRLQTPLQKR